ncbi:MAG: hypothetical protein LBC12_07460 [Nitrososphaerota archaeon]|nr:hypothetical protein [Nitrososphaerota archaeon]
MIKFENIKGYRDEVLRRITGVKRATFEKMSDILSGALTNVLHLAV